jgi:hypothetical protein
LASTLIAAVADVRVRLRSARPRTAAQKFALNSASSDATQSRND